MDTMSGSQQSFDVFDVRKIRKLISLMQENDLTEIDLKHADSAVRIKRGGEVANARKRELNSGSEIRKRTPQ